jgi:aldehyde dehydrogenase (NAD+)
LILELGGSSPLLVLEDADIAEAVQITIAGVFKNSGQRCTAIRRVLVHHSIAEPYVSRLADGVRELKYGDPYDPETDLGTLIDEEAARLIESRIEATVSAGAQLLVGGIRQGALLAPTVMDRVENDHPLVAEETFGPVAAVIRFADLDEAIGLANDTAYGLSSGVVSNHWPSIQRVISELQVGTVNVNEAPGYRLEWTPFGGIKASGLGYKEGVVEAMKGMTNIKTYSLPWDEP